MMRYWILIVLSTTLLIGHDAVAAQNACGERVTRASDFEVSPVRRRLSAFVPTLTLQVSDELARYDAPYEPGVQTSLRPDFVIARSGGVSSAVDWRISADWDLLAVARAFTSDDDFQTDQGRRTSSPDCARGESAPDEPESGAVAGEEEEEVSR